MANSDTIEHTDAPAGDAGEREQSSLTAVLLDRQPLWLGALASVLERYGIATVATSTTADAALREVELLEPTALVLDPWVADGDMTGLALISAVRERFGALRIVGLGSVKGAAQIDAAFAAGVDAYMLKVAHPEEVAQTIKHVCSDVIFFGTLAARAAGREPRAVGEERDEVRLTKRELEILHIVAEGRANGEIAKLLWVTEQTVKFHLSNIYKKLGVANRTQAGHCAHLNSHLTASTEATVGGSYREYISSEDLDKG